jgi:hypothetical protein
MRISRCVLCAIVLLLPSILFAVPSDVSFSQSAPEIARFEFVEITAAVSAPDAGNPFLDAALSGSLDSADGSRHWSVDGFCDSADGAVFRIRFMAPLAGDYKYAVTYRQGSFTKSSSGTFHASEAHKRGLVAVDPAYPWHFIWQGTGEHYFFNGTTAYWLVGFRDDHTIQYTVDRLHRLKVNRMRVTISGREASTYFGEPVMSGEAWTPLIAAWQAQSPDDPLHPGFDYTRFNLPYWQKFDRMLRFARDCDMIVSLVLDMGDSRVHPVAGGEDEHRFIRYAVNRFGPFSNITWDLGDDLDSYRDEKWTHETGVLIQNLDPYTHLETSHPAVTNDHQDRAASWFGFTSYQEWSRKQHELILASRKLQEKTGRIIPQTNEEYGYEDHYPFWAAPDSDRADALRRTAWDIYMAGGYQTAGESARRGTNIRPDLGGGWMNGRGDDTQTMFLGYGHIVDFFTSFDWWKTNPHDELVNNGAYCVADPGKTYAVYLPHGGKVTIQLQSGRYRATWFSAVTGEKIELPPADGPAWTSPEAPNQYDWALLLQAM